MGRNGLSSVGPELYVPVNWGHVFDWFSPSWVVNQLIRKTVIPKWEFIRKRVECSAVEC
jgi:hypothetical protein